MALSLTSTLTTEVPTTTSVDASTRVKSVTFDLDNSQATAVIVKEMDGKDVGYTAIKVK